MVSAHLMVSVSARSPARNRVRKCGSRTANRRAGRVLALDGAEGGRGGEQGGDAMLGDDPPEGAGIGGADGLALVEHAGGAGEQRGIDDIAVADHPADVGGGPEDFARPRCRRCCSSTRRAPPGGRHCRGRRPWAGRWCRRCRGCRADRWRRPATQASRRPRSRAAATRLAGHGRGPPPARRRIAGAAGTITERGGASDWARARSSSGL